METTVDVLEAFSVDVGIYLGGADVGVSQHLLDNSQIGAATKHMGGK